jgi:glycosyltransferase involved in cell wall biosynthesis
VEEFDAKRSASRRGRDGRVVLGWLGSETTVWNLYTIIEALEDVFRRHPHLHLRLLGVPSDHQLLSLFEHVRASNTPAYDADEMIDEVLSMDIGLFPVMALENAAMHGITKALVYMGGAAAIVASPVGDIPALIRDGENGLLASGREDWAAKLDRLIVDPALRDRIAQQGLRTAREGYSLSRCFDHLREALGI